MSHHEQTHAGRTVSQTTSVATIGQAFSHKKAFSIPP